MKLIFSGLALTTAIVMYCSCNSGDSQNVPKNDSLKTASDKEKVAATVKTIDTAEYKKRMLALANGDTTGRWPVKAPYPLPGAIFPFNRVVAYYGNLYSTRMGALGEFPKTEMIKRLKEECAKWQKADSATPVIPALHYIAITAQGAPGKDGKYRFRMPFSQIDTILSWARGFKALTFIDIQVGHSTLQQEVPLFKEYFKMPDFHFGIDPEFSMKGGQKPGTVIGTFNADDVNYVIDYLATIVKENNLPPKILVIHRFTNDMVMNAHNIKKVPEVQVVIDMDGWGGKELKAGTYKRFITEQPVQFSGFKLFYKNDLKKGSSGMYTPAELLRFTPKPVYIQYQ